MGFICFAATIRRCVTRIPVGSTAPCLHASSCEQEHWLAWIEGRYSRVFSVKTFKATKAGAMAMAMKATMTRKEGNDDQKRLHRTPLKLTLA
jgi:hypothetical protein